MVRLAEWPRTPNLNDELREWVRLHLDALGVDDVAVYAVAGREDDERRILVVTEVGLLDSWYAPRGSTARFSLNIRLYPWQAVHGVDLRGETYRLWAHEHQSRWRLRLARPAFDALAETPELGKALTQFAAACSVMAEPAGQPEPSGDGPMPSRAASRQAMDEPAFAPPPEAESTDGASAPAPRPSSPPTDVEPPERPPIRVEPDLEREPAPEDERAVDLARRLGLR